MNKTKQNKLPEYAVLSIAYRLIRLMMTPCNDEILQLFIKLTSSNLTSSKNLVIANRNLSSRAEIIYAQAGLVERQEQGCKLIQRNFTLDEGWVKVNNFHPTQHLTQLGPLGQG